MKYLVAFLEKFKFKWLAFGAFISWAAAVYHLHLEDMPRMDMCFGMAWAYLSAFVWLNVEDNENINSVGTWIALFILAGVLISDAWA